MRGKLLDLSRGVDGKWRLTVALPPGVTHVWDELHDKDVSVEITKYREKRSRDANAYFHVLVNKIAAVQGLSDTEVKRLLVIDYGALERDEAGKKVGAKVPASVDITQYYPYARCYDTVTENGKEYTCYLFYKRTHTLNTKEMARLIDGAVKEAKALGIETLPPHELEALEAAWEARTA